MSDKLSPSLSADGIWHLIRLTWITRAKAQDFWKDLKVPALADLWGKENWALNADLETTIQAMSLPPLVAAAANKPTGFVNSYNKWRNSSRKWCQDNRADLLTIFRDATLLSLNDQSRFALAKKVEKLPGVPPPSGAVGDASPASVLTPLLACLDPHRRFPVINGRKAVQRLLSKLGLANHTVSEQVKGMLGLIGKNGIADCFMLDVLADSVVAFAKKVPKIPASHKKVENGSSLPDFDTEEREAVQQSKTIHYRNRHNKMTGALKNICKGWELKRGTQPHCCYDVLIENYEGTGRDLLLEVKPDPDRGSIRIAIGQLLDYRRFIPHQAGTDLAMLTISRPEQTYRQLLLDLQISPIWFSNDSCKTLAGEGGVWESWKAALGI